MNTVFYSDCKKLKTNVLEISSGTFYFLENKYNEFLDLLKDDSFIAFFIVKDPYEVNFYYNKYEHIKANIVDSKSVLAAKQSGSNMFIFDCKREHDLIYVMKNFSI